MHFRLDGKVLAITRNLGHNLEFVELVNNHGGTVLSLPTIKLVPRDPLILLQFMKLILKKNYKYYIFMSSNSVEFLFSFAKETGLFHDILKEFRKKKIICLGPSVKNCLQEKGIYTNLMPKKYSSRDLLNYLKETKIEKGSSVMIPRSTAASSYMNRSLSDLGLKVDEFYLYTPKTEDASGIWVEFSELLENGKVHSLIFTSPSSVRSFCKIMQSILPQFRDYCANIEALISIGPLTTDELRL